MKNEIGLYGLGVMGQSLVLNIANHGHSIAVFNRSSGKTETFMQEKVTGQPITATYSLEEFVDALELPRRILLMVTAGSVTDATIENLLPLLSKGDIIVDCGNSFYKDTVRREAYLKEKGINFFGTGVSGGEMGALLGPSMMPGGDREAYRYLEPVFMDIAAKTPSGDACCGYIGPDGAGHYVKMVHNGIEYADIQIICEAYHMMKAVAGMTNAQIQQVFETWNKGRLRSYLIEITAEILKRKDEETGNDLIDMILDRAGQKGTGKWTSMEGLDIGCVIPTVAESVFARNMSAIKDERVRVSKLFDSRPFYPLADTFLEDLEKAVYAAKVCCYAQGFRLLKEASEANSWGLKFGEIALLWRAGCIIRADFLEDIKRAFDIDPDCPNLIATEKFSAELKTAETAWRQIVLCGIGNGCYLPALTSTLNYFDGYRSARLPANLLQAQRDYFGAHTYQRVDKDPSQAFHTVWETL